MSVNFALKSPMTIIARVVGPRGVVRELSSILDFNSEYSAIFSRQALELGFNEGATTPRNWSIQHPDKVPILFDLRGIERGTMITLKTVSVGRLVAEDVDAVIFELDFPRMMPFDLVLGRTFLKHFRLTVDSRAGYVSLT